ncbi:MAG: thioredoxin domain-containing protein [Gaiellales bacterium]
MTNRLREATSPYLLQHADNPVDWWPWGEKAFAEARERDRPLLVSVGYSSCHWCHVMAHESFDDPETARLMNELFVNVKVDREERPDVDAVTMDATVSLTGSGGWPTTVFLTPEGRPFYAGTYYPPTARHGLPAFRDLLHAVDRAWAGQRDAVETQAEKLTAALGRAVALGASDGELTPKLLDDAEEHIARAFDGRHGGFGGAPKFPPASTIELLLRRETPRAEEMVRRTLDAMAAGGMHDLVGGGFHRYAVDAHWLVPHFEKMLYDNALLASAYLHAGVKLAEPRYVAIAAATVEHMLRDLTAADGGLASALDADTEGVEGLTYTWTAPELAAAGVDERVLHPFEDGRSIIRGELHPEQRAALLAIRETRPQPFRDDKVIASWNGLALAAVAEAGRRLGRTDWIAAAVRIGETCVTGLAGPDGEVLRSRRAGRTSGGGFLDDYANLAHGLIELHLATGDTTWLHHAHRLVRSAIDRFRDEATGAFFLAAAGHDPLVVARSRDLADDPTPAGNSMIASVAIRVGRLWGDLELEEIGAAALATLTPALRQAPRAFSWALCAVDLVLAPPRELAIVAPPAGALARSALAPFAPRTVAAFGPDETIPLLAGKHPVDGRPTVYICERFACRAPVTDPAALLG